MPDRRAVPRLREGLTVVNKKLLVNSLFTALMALGYLINLVIFQHPGVAFVMLLASVIGGAMMLSELLSIKRTR